MWIRDSQNGDNDGSNEKRNKKIETDGDQGVTGIGAQSIQRTVSQIHHPAQTVDDIQPDGYDEKYAGQNKTVQSNVHGSGNNAHDNPLKARVYGLQLPVHGWQTLKP
eukprot:TRINITY_DN8019_c0_g1_i1.p3 TRINITY_DN8019_c0_g1~~TRINITY_DN8019_c0_g1_i1.p3  ORF type:complete len:122 (-),score=1.08 TRINITY_DN8019_c0_g1_i1:155-475(-)